MSHRIYVPSTALNCEEWHTCVSWRACSSELFVDCMPMALYNFIKSKSWPSLPDRTRATPMFEALHLHTLHAWACTQRNLIMSQPLRNSGNCFSQTQSPCFGSSPTQPEKQVWHNYEVINIWVEVQRTLLIKTLSSQTRHLWSIVLPQSPSGHVLPDSNHCVDLSPRYLCLPPWINWEMWFSCHPCHIFTAWSMRALKQCTRPLIAASEGGTKFCHCQNKYDNPNYLMIG